MFLQHINESHTDTLWEGFCSQCDAHIVGDDKPLRFEFQHMLKVHVKGADVVQIDQDENNFRPALKMRRLDGDTLSIASNLIK